MIGPPQLTRRAPQPYVAIPFTVTMATFPWSSAICALSFREHADLFDARQCRNLLPSPLWGREEIAAPLVLEPNYHPRSTARSILPS